MFTVDSEHLIFTEYTFRVKIGLYTMMKRRKERTYTQKGKQRNYVRNVFFLVTHQNYVLILSQLLIITFGVLVLVPLFNFSFELSLTTAGIRYLSLSTFPRFILNPVSIFFFVLNFLILSVFIMFEDFFLKEYFYLKHHKLKIRGFSLLYSSAMLTFKAITSFNIRYFLTVWILMISFNLPLLVFALRNSTILRYLIFETSSQIIWGLVLGVYLTAVLFVNRKQGFLLKKHALWNVVQGITFILLYIMALIIMILLISLFVPRMYAIAAFMSLLNHMNQFYSILLFVVSVSLHYALYMILNSKSLELPEEEVINQPKMTLRFFLAAPSRKLFALLLVMLLSFNLYAYIGILRNGSLLQAISFDQITVTSHRGYSYNFPENTLVAIERAIEVYTDYVEVDVRVTLDDEFVLLHDDNLRRTTGVNQSISQVSVETATALDAGIWLHEQFRGTTIPTLREALELTKGRVGLNLDLKLTENQSYVIPDLVALIDEFDMQYQVVLTSTCLSCLEIAKELNPNLQTGYITYRITPALLANPLIDMMSMRSTFVTQSIVEQIHQADKKILVWTVNSRGEIERMSRLGVNSIITDRPSYAKEVLFELTADQYIISLLKIILN